LDALRQEKTNLPYPVHLLAFSDDEGIRFQTTYLGSRSITAPLDAETLAAKDAAGVTVQQAIASESPAPQVAPIRYAPTECRGYVELHIEQGRMLEETDESACVVITIGKIHVHPGASNSIPQSSTFSIDLRHSDDTIRRTSLEILHASFRQIAADRERKSASGISIMATAKPTPPTTARRSKATASPASGMN
jgi:acetylornithine deacetylase/succinyl-diaminopimelate desuccinylase-like protein